jgi:hypothetical protein
MQQVAEVAFAKDNDVIEALTSDRGDVPLRISIPPGRTGWDRSLANAHGAIAPEEFATIGPVPIPHHIAHTPKADMGADSFIHRHLTQTRSRRRSADLNEPRALVFEGGQDRPRGEAGLALPRPPCAPCAL